MKVLDAMTFQAAFEFDSGWVHRVACHKTVVMGKEGGIELVAWLEGDGAAGMEGAARRRCQGRGQFAFQHNALALARGIRGWRGREQGLGIGVLRVPENIVARALFHDTAQIHHHHLVGDVFHHGKIVADEEIGEVVLLLQVGEEIEDLRLNGNIEGRDRFIEHENFGIEHERPGNGNALALAAGKHVGVAVVVFRTQTHACHHGAGFFLALGFWRFRIDQQRLFQNGADFLAGIERAVGILKNDLHFGPQRPQGLRSCADNVVAADVERAGGRQFNHGDKAGEG